MIIHKGLTTDKWFKLSLAEQLANVGADVGRAIKWRNRGDKEYSSNAFDRALELLDLTAADPKNSKHRRREILRVREALVDYLIFDNIYGSTDELWENYFYQFNYAAALERGR